MILADTSAWLEHDRATGSAIDRRLAALLDVADDKVEVAVTEPVVMEVTAGARDDRREAQLHRLLARARLLRFDAAVDFAGATRIDRRCRAAGVTPRGMVDCMIAAVAHRHGAALLAVDADLLRVAEVIGVELDPASTASRR